MTEVREAKELRLLAKEPLKWTKSLEEEEMPQVSPETRRQGWHQETECFGKIKNKSLGSADMTSENKWCCNQKERQWHLSFWGVQNKLPQNVYS